MSSRHAITFFAVLILVGVLLIGTVHAQNINSTNYTILDPKVDSGTGESSSTNYKALTQINNGVEGNQLSSSLYSVKSGNAYTFMANVPKVKCFETVTTVSTLCTGLLHSQGMVQECGESGCYDRAKFEIDAQNNPTDTVYVIEVSTDSFSTIKVVDATTHTLKSIASKTISDYQTKSAWESGAYSAFNIFGLLPNTAYSIRIRALHGDYTESSPSPVVNATTSVPTVLLDLDIGTSSSANTNAPYTINFGALNPETASEATNKIWVDFSTNAVSGSSLYVKDSNSGLFSSSKSYTLASASEDLSLTASGDGFGLKTGTIQSDATATGFMAANSQYQTAGSQQVGAVNSSTPTQILCSSSIVSDTCPTSNGNPVLNGRIEIKLLARASLNASAASDYQTVLTFTAVTTTW